MRRRLLLAVTGWLVTGLLAIGAGVAVIDRLGEPLTDTGLRPLSAAEVDEALVLASSRPGAPPAPASTSGAPSRTAPAAPSAPASTASPGTPPTGPAPAPTVTVTVTQAPTASAAPTATGPTGPTASAAPSVSAGRSGVLDTPGGRVIARCQNALVTLRSWSPAQGFQADDVERGPASRAYVEFESEEREIKVEVYCAADGSPTHRARG
ncbi:hypothetical protein [Streptosporangium sp. NPDC023615]|uniref:hypothetical protein n=1 Tax=Streptosporangium sp. NPDC023615 TaxID=3154794 RepID=UPI003445FE51